MLDLTGRPDYYLEPGHVCFSASPLVIRTVLGSCVAVCLWDEELRYGGAAHFSRPWARTPETATPHYGNAATIALIRAMEAAGSRLENLVAQLAGGASPDSPDKDDVGMANVAAAQRMLQRKGIAIASEDVGGTMGRKIVFDTHTGHLVVLKVHRVRETDWAAD